MRRALHVFGVTAALSVGLCVSGATAEEPEASGGFQRFRRTFVPRETPTPGDQQTGDRRSPRRGGEPTRPGRVPPAPQPHPDMPMPEGFVPLRPAAAPPASALDAPSAPATALNFPALGDDNTSIPPDTHGAVGPTKVMTVLNTQVQVFDRLGVPVGAAQSLNGFWTGAATAGVFDPRVHFDPDPAWGLGRWIWAAVQGAQAPSSGILLGVSADEEPVRAPSVLIPAVDTDVIPNAACPAPPCPVWADYPSVGFNKKWVVVQVNMFNISDNQFNETQIYVFDKAALYGGTFTSALFASAVDGATQVPTVTYSFGPTGIEELYLLQRWNSGAGALRLYEITGAVGSEALNPIGFVIGTPWLNSPGGADFAPQLQTCVINPPAQCAGAPCRIQVNDSRIQKAVYRAGSLWATQTVFFPAGGPAERASVQWWEVLPDTTVLQQGLIDDNTNQLFYAFPSLSVNRHGDVLLGYSKFDVGGYAGGYYAFRNAFDPPSTMQAEALLKNGESCYFKDFASLKNRWGDYSATVVDPTDDTKLWTIQEYAETPLGGFDRWGTWWGMLDPTRTLSIGDVTLDEGDAGPTVFSFDVTLSEPTVQTVTVEWLTQDQTATTADGDYAPVASTVVTFNPGETSRQVDVNVTGDTKYELDETFQVNLANPTGADILDGVGVGTIVNDDPLPAISIGDLTIVEGNGGADATAFIFPVSLSGPSEPVVQASWTSTPGSALPGAFPAFDYTAGVPMMVSFPSGVVNQTVTVLAHGDPNPELDEEFYVDLSAPVNGTLLKSRGVGNVLDDDTAMPGVVAFSVVSDSLLPHGPADGRNRLQWKTPTAAAGATQFLIKYNRSAGPGGSCAPPDPANPGVASFGALVGPPVAPGATQSLSHGTLNLDWEYCYTIWIQYLGPTWSLPGEFMSARPFNAAPGQKVKWKYYTGTTVLAAPTVGVDAVIVPSNDTYVHAMQRGLAGGPWRASPWRPRGLGSVAQHRAPVIPLAAGSRAFIATQDGRVHAIDTANGNLLWTTPLAEGAAQGAPAGIFTDFGGAWDYVLVGTSSGSNDKFYALDPVTGAVIDEYPGVGDTFVQIGAILGMASVDYATNKVYFASQEGGNNDSVWCLDLGPPGTTALSLAWSTTTPGPVNGSPVLRNGRVYVVDQNSAIWSIRASDGGDRYSFSLGDGDGRGFPFPDRRNGNLYVTTAGGKVHGVTDTGSGFLRPWPELDLSPSAPSVVLYQPGTDRLFVGVDQDPLNGGNAGLLQIDVSTGTIVGNVQLEQVSQVIGPPSLDIGFGLLHVGSEAGILYAVEVPF